MSCSFFGVGVGEQLFAISTEFTKGLHGEEVLKDRLRIDIRKNFLSVDLR